LLVQFSNASVGVDRIISDGLPARPLPEDVMSAAAAVRPPAVPTLGLLLWLVQSCGGSTPVAPTSVGPPQPFDVVADFYDGTLTTTVTRHDVLDACLSPYGDVGKEYTFPIQVIRSGEMMVIELPTEAGAYNATTDGHQFKIVADGAAYPCPNRDHPVSGHTLVTGTIAPDFVGFEGHEVSRELRPDGTLAAQRELEWSAELRYRSTGPYRLMPYPEQPAPTVPTFPGL